MKLAQAGAFALTLSTGFGLRDLLQRHKTAAWIIVALVVANEIRGIALVYAILRAWWT
jgi:hypothetical protein